MALLEFCCDLRMKNKLKQRLNMIRTEWNFTVTYIALKIFLFERSFANMPNSYNNNELQILYGGEKRLREIMKQTIDVFASNSKTKQNAFHKCQIA